eukprot:gene4003-biopygen6162
MGTRPRLRVGLDPASGSIDISVLLRLSWLGKPRLGDSLCGFSLSSEPWSEYAVGMPSPLASVWYDLPQARAPWSNHRGGKMGRRLCHRQRHQLLPSPEGGGQVTHPNALHMGYG